MKLQIDKRPSRPWQILACLMLLVLSCPTPSFAAKVGGLIAASDTGLAIVGARVTLLAQDEPAATAYEPKMDGRGGFQFEDLPGGLFQLAIGASGYATQKMELSLIATDSLFLEINLSFDGVIMEGMVVMGQSTDIEQDLQTGYTSLDQQTLAEIPSIIEDDPLRALQLLPGVQSASDVSSGLYIRGGGPDQNLIMMEGVTIYNPTHAFGFFSTFNNDAVNSISLFKGAYPASYGGRLGGLIDVDLKHETKPKTSGKVGLSFISGRIFLEGRAGQDHWWVGGRRSFLEPMLKALSTPEDPIPQWYFYDTNFGYTSYRGGGMTRLLFYKGRDNVEVDLDTDTQINLGWGNTAGSLSHERYLTDYLEGKITLSHSRYNSETNAEILSTAYQVTNSLKDTSLKGQLDWQAGDNHRLISGLGYSWYEFQYLENFNQNNSLDYGNRAGELAAFLEDNWFPDDQTTVRTGLRYSYLSNGSRQFVEPRFSASRQVKPDLRLKVGGGLYNQYLQLIATEGFSSGDYYVPIDESADLGRSWQVVLGADWQTTQNTKISIEAYNTGLKNLVVLDNNVPADQSSLQTDDLFVTGGKGYARGVEVFLRHQRENWSGWLGYTLGWTQRTFDEINGGNSFAPKYDRRHDLNLMLTRQAGSWRLAAVLRYASGQAFTPAAARYQLQDPSTNGIDDTGQILSGSRNSGRLLPYHRMDLSARRPIRLFGLKGEFVAEIFNVYNRRNEWFVQYDTEEDLTEATVVKMLPLIPSLGVNIEF